MSKIFRPPLGLLSLLDTKAVGQNPDELSSIVQATLDLSPLFLASLPLEAVGSGSAACSGLGAFDVFATVPERELWWLYGGWAQWTASDPLERARGQVVGLAPGAGIPSFGSLAGPDIANATNTVAAASLLLPQPLVLTPGWRLGAWTTHFIFVSDISVTAAFTVRRLSI